jgi:hypothetical protein
MIYQFAKTKRACTFALLMTLLFGQAIAVPIATNQTSEIVFKTHFVKRIDYVYNNDGERLQHHINFFHGTGGGYDIDEQLIDSGGIICLKISKNGKTVIKKELPRWCGLSEDSYMILDPTKDTTDKQIVFRDINKDGKPELILLYDNGSNHGNTGCFIFQFDGSRPAKEIYKADLPFPKFEDIDKDGKYEIVLTDNTFSYWKDSAYCQYGGERVVLALQGGTYKASTKYTFASAPSVSKFNSIVQEMKRETIKYKSKCKPGTEVMTPDTWKPLISLIYSGNVSTAKRILQTVYPGNTLLIVTPNPDCIKDTPTETKMHFWQEMVKQAKTSLYAKYLFANLN